MSKGFAEPRTEALRGLGENVPPLAWFDPRESAEGLGKIINTHLSRNAKLVETL